MTTKIKYIDITKDDSKVQTLTDTAIKAMKTGQTKVQIAIVAMAQSYMLSNDQETFLKRANYIVEELPDGVNKQGLVDWFVKICGLVVSEEESCFIAASGKDYVFERWNDKDPKTGVKAAMWWTFKIPNPWAGYDLNAKLDKVLTDLDKAKNRVAKAKKDGEDISELVKTSLTADVITRITALVAVGEGLEHNH